MKRGTTVTWEPNSDAGETGGRGVTISDEYDGHVLVAVHAPPGARHQVIYCAVTWLTPAWETPTAAPPSAL